MNSRVKSWMLALMLVMGLVAYLPARGAGARPLTDPLPQTKTPTSARFDITGNLGISGGQGLGDLNFQLTGSGALSGKNVQEDITINIPNLFPTQPSGGPSPASPSAIKVSVIIVGNKVYTKTDTEPPQGNTKWVVSDLSQMGGMQSAFPGMGSNLIGPNSAYAAAFTTTQVGKETLNGAATTKYQVNVDLRELFQLTGTKIDAQTEQTLQNSKLTMFMWVGDSDMHVHQLSLMLNSTVPSATPNTPPSTVTFNLNIAFKDFDTAITIIPPPESETVSAGVGSPASSLFPGGLGPTMLGPIGMPAGMPGVAMPTGMPRTGHGDQDNLLPLLAALGLSCLAAGGLIRRPRPAR